MSVEELGDAEYGTGRGLPRELPYGEIAKTPDVEMIDIWSPGEVPNATISKR